MNPFRADRYGGINRMPSELPEEYPAGVAGPVTVRRATPEELARCRALEPPRQLPYIAHDWRGRIVAGWDL